MTLGAGVLVLRCGHISHIVIVKMHYFLKNLLVYSHEKIRQTKYIVMMTKEGSTKIVNFMTPGAGILMLGRDHISYILNMYFIYFTIYSRLIAIVLRDYDDAFL